MGMREWYGGFCSGINEANLYMDVRCPIVCQHPEPTVQQNTDDPGVLCRVRMMDQYWSVLEGGQAIWCSCSDGGPSCSEWYSSGMMGCDRGCNRGSIFRLCRACVFVRSSENVGCIVSVHLWDVRSSRCFGVPILRKDGHISAEIKVHGVRVNVLSIL